MLRVESHAVSRESGYDLNMTSVWARLNVEMLLTQLVAWLPRLLSAIVILVLFSLLWRFTKPAVLQILSRAGLDHALSQMVLSVYRFTVMTLGFIMAANQVGVDVGAALAGLGVVGLTIGFAARDSLSNVMAGFLILWDKPFRSGDWVTLGDKYGKVEEITMRTTRLLTWNNTRIIIPNQSVINEVLVNHSSYGMIRVEVPISMQPTRDVSTARKEIIETVRGIEGVLSDPPPSVVVRAIDAARISLTVQVWTADAEQEMPIQFRILEASRPLLQNPHEA
ncbi:MAG TPA: mechanosensitive ion channel [Terriglobia bacterium]|nr:mechanosensitive ion channel [Terriglobia bacterium]